MANEEQVTIRLNNAIYEQFRRAVENAEPLVGEFGHLTEITLPCELLGAVLSAMEWTNRTQCDWKAR